MSGIHAIGLLILLIGLVETARLLLLARRTYREVRSASDDPRDWRSACHKLRSEGLRFVKQVIALVGLVLGYVNIPDLWRVEGRNACFVVIGVLLLVNSERALWFQRKVRRGWP